MAYIPLDDLEVYKVAMQIGEEVWAVVDSWEVFPKKTIGVQFCDAADSIAANIAEGHGRFHFKENKNFCFYARGSLLETKSWLYKANNRNLIKTPEFESIKQLLIKEHGLLNKYLKSIGQSSSEKNTLHEPDDFYSPNSTNEPPPFDP